MSAEGQDRSAYQPVTGWHGQNFGIVKATEGTSYRDSSFAGNWAALKRWGLPRGAYHFLHPDLDGVAQGRFFMSVVRAHGLRSGDMLWADSEIPSPHADAVTLAFLNQCAAEAPAGVQIGTYTNHNVGQTLHRTAETWPELWFAWPSWTAPPASLISPWKQWRFWQWGTGALGRGAVDLDGYNGTVADLHRWLFGPVRYRHWWQPGLWSLLWVAERNHTTPEEMIRLAQADSHRYRPAMIRYIERGDWSARLPAGGVTLFAPVS